MTTNKSWNYYDWYDYRPSFESYYDGLESELAGLEEPVTEVNTTLPPLGLEFENDDAAWVMACTFLIFTMQTGFGLFESGMCSQKNEVNILMKNIVDVAIGGFLFWAVGYSIVKGDHPRYTTRFFGVGKYFFTPNANVRGTGEEFLDFFLQTGYVTTATTIPSGAMAERYV